MKRLLLSIFIILPYMLVAQAKKTATKSVTASKAKTTVASKNTLQTSIIRGKAVYGTFCLACHQEDGSGVPNMNPPIVKTSWVLGSKTVLIQQILKGSANKVEIDGETFHNTMPAQAQLTDQQIADVLTFVRNSFGNRASMVTPAEVKAVRAKTK
jgi:mono/diheme cytochrome c family protein